ncbi:type II secretion system protein J [Pricia sp.]|uniref:PulJ/GspJ family protein n=1 Tax=Pricia sp. TaxID=2268138 RepID=UPI003593A5BE
MGNRMKKVRAFTLAEMIVTLLITTIVVGMAFAVLNLVQRQMLGIERNYERTTELDRLRQSLWIDFNRYGTIAYDEKNGELSFSNEMGTQKYKLDKNLIVKGKDTFDLIWEHRRFLFENIERTSGEIDALDLWTGKAHGGRRLFVYKNNSADTYMK